MLIQIFAIAQSNVIPKPQPIPTTIYDSTQNSENLELTANIGAGLIRNILSPQFNIQLHYTTKKLWQIGINSTSYFLFKEDSSNDYKCYINTFINAEFIKQGTSLRDTKNSNNSGGLGIGYLLSSNGNYFKGNTFKIYYIIKQKNLEILPELIMTNNFKSFFPGVTIRF